MHERVTAIILSGGQGSRMGNRNKGLMLYQGKPLIEHVIERISPQVEDIVISANQDIDRYQQFGYPVVQDQTDSMGPLSGISSAGKRCLQPLCVFVPCDMPHLPVDLVEQLAGAMQTDAVSICSDGQDQPLVSLINTAILEDIDKFLERGQRSVKGWLDQHDRTLLHWDNEPLAFQNFNHESDLMAD